MLWLDNLLSSSSGGPNGGLILLPENFNRDHHHMMQGRVHSLGKDSCCFFRALCFTIAVKLLWVIQTCKSRQWITYVAAALVTNERLLLPFRKRSLLWPFHRSTCPSALALTTVRLSALKRHASILAGSSLRGGFSAYRNNQNHYHNYLIITLVRNKL